MSQSRSQALLGEHLALEQRCELLCRRAASSDWDGLAADWGEFAAALEQRFAFEEGVLFTALEPLGRGRRALVNALKAEHAALRQLVGAVGDQIEVRAVRPVTIDVLGEQLCEHRALEAQLVYPWVDEGTPMVA